VWKSLRRLVSAKAASPARSQKIVWRMNERAPGGGEWVDKSAPNSHTDTALASGAESTGSGWLMSTMDLMKGADIALVPHEADTRATSPPPSTPAPGTTDFTSASRRSLTRELSELNERRSDDARSMPRPSSPRRKVGKMPTHDRRKARDRKEVIVRRLKGLLSRPLSLLRRDGKVHVVLVERRKATALLPIRAELEARLRVYAHDHPDRPTRELFFVHAVLGREGWAGVETIASRVLGHALSQAEELRGLESSDFLEMFIDRLRTLWLGAVHRVHHPSEVNDRG